MARKRGQNDIKADTLIPSSQLSTKPGQVQCAILAGAVLVGLAANSLCGLWWFDPAIALAIAAVCVREGQNAWRGEQCGCATCS
jgi:divalent metal cation (Fe/Co/Zn/Cd) transporter